MENTDLRKSVEQLLENIFNLTRSKNFDIKRNFVLKTKRFADDPLDPNNNENTMLKLGYDPEDVLEEIKALTIRDFYRLKEDYKDGRDKPFFEFIKVIYGRQVYIKIKMHELREETILCVSFHFQEQYINDSRFPFR